MSNSYQVLPHRLLSAGTTIKHQQGLSSEPITLADTAQSVLTDFRHARPFSISSTANIEQVNSRMIACGVRLLFVAEADTLLQGLVTFNDLFGEKPVLYIQQHGGSREEILAQDIMTPLAQLEAMQHADMEKARVGDIVETIKSTGRQHLLVKDSLEDGSEVITGLFSSTQIEKLVGVKIELSPRANSFADLERALTE